VLAARLAVEPAKSSKAGVAAGTELVLRARDVLDWARFLADSYAPVVEVART
jgi:hypothetical protein